MIKTSRRLIYGRMESQLAAVPVDYSKKESSIVHHDNNAHQKGVPENDLLDYFEILASLEQFLENSIITVKKPYALIKRIFKNVKFDKHIE